MTDFYGFILLMILGDSLKNEHLCPNQLKLSVQLKTRNHVKGLLSLSSLLRAVIEPHPITLNQLELEVLDELQF